MLAADALRATLALLWMQGRGLHATLRLLLHGRLHLMRGPGDAPHGDVLLCMLGWHMLLLWRGRLPWVQRRM